MVSGRAFLHPDHVLIIRRALPGHIAAGRDILDRVLVLPLFDFSMTVSEGEPRCIVVVHCWPIDNLRPGGVWVSGHLHHEIPVIDALLAFIDQHPGAAQYLRAADQTGPAAESDARPGDEVGSRQRHHLALYAT